MQNPFESIDSRLAIIEKYLVKFDDRFTPPSKTAPEAPDRYVSRSEAKGILGKVSDPTMWDWEKKGIIKPYNLGNKIFYKYSELMQSGKFVDRTQK